MDINETLLRHLATGAGAASLLRNSQQNIVELVIAFFSARTDIRRLAAAQDVAQEILSRNDLTDLIEIRDVVAKQELRRQIKYGKQQDHTAHTVYLYLLGLWLYDNLPQFHLAVGEYCKAENPHDRDEYFLLQWTYASLLHDVGYAFQNLEKETKNDRLLIDNLYTWDWVRRQVGDLTGVAEEALNKAFDEWMQTYGRKMRPGTATYADDSYVEVLERLADAPWLRDLHESFRGKDIFEVLGLNIPLLREYAMEVAQDGYGGFGRCVDHAVASGLLLFQYTSFWYWIMNYVRSNNDMGTYLQVSGKFNYDLQNIITDFVPACHAVAFHNIQKRTQTGKKIIPNLTIKDEPITCLAILSDELQRWDRYPAGSTYLDDYRLFSASTLESDDISLMCNGTRENSLGKFRVRTWAHTANGKELLKDLQSTIVDRLPIYLELIEIDI